MHRKIGLLSWDKRAAIVRRYPVFCSFPCVRCFPVSVIHQTLTWTTGSAYVILFMRAYTHGVGHTDESAKHFDSEKFWFFSPCAPDRDWTSGLWISVDTLPIESSRHPSLKLYPSDKGTKMYRVLTPEWHRLKVSQSHSLYPSVKDTKYSP